MGAIDIAIEVEDVNFQHGPAGARHRRPHAEARCARQCTFGQTMQLRDEDPGKRRTVVLHLHVGSSKAESAPDLITVDDPPADAI